MTSPASSRSRSVRSPAQRDSRTTCNSEGETVSAKSNCGVRVVEGQHRSYVTDFIRDARGGGCMAGVPPDNLGFRLVREPRSWVSGIARALNIVRT